MTLRKRLQGQDGFSMMIVMGVLTICAALTVAVFSAVVGDLPLRKESRDKKVAFAAAEAGLNFYMSRLNQDNDYWTKCTTVAAPNASEPSPVNQRWDGGGADPRAFRNVPGEASRYTVELMPAVGATCQTSDPAGTMIDPSSGTMRLRTTGTAGAEKRSILATLRRRSFLDYLYFTDYETTDPAVYAGVGDVNKATTECTRYRASRTSYCSEIQFAPGDKINGPFHTNDDILTCDGATFGRPGKADRLEASGPAPGYKKNCSATAPNFNGTFQAGVPALAVPSSNAKVAQAAAPGYVFTGQTRICINGTTMTVSALPNPIPPPPATCSGTSMALPPNGVIYVKNGAGCGSGLSPAFQTYTEPTGCANVHISGSYAQSLTVVSDKDIVVEGNLQRSGDYLLGLIATNFVRIYHPVDNRSGNTCNSITGTLQNVTVEAAILTLQHSFIVDNYYCGGQLGTLSVFGAIAQRFRGAVGTTQPSGYTKNYTYDDRFKLRNPPFFLDPVSAAWRILRRNEQSPAR